MANFIKRAINNVKDFTKEYIAEPIGDFVNYVSGVKATQDYNAKEAETQRNWEETMRNSSVKSIQEQLKKAGINSAMYWSNGGSGAAVPNGAAASSSASGGMAIASIIGSVAGMTVGLARNGMKSQAKQAAYMVMKSLNQEQRQRYDFNNVFDDLDNIEL